MVGFGDVIVGAIMEVCAGLFGSWANKSALRKKIHFGFWLLIGTAMCLVLVYFSLDAAYAQKSWAFALMGMAALAAMIGFWMLALRKWREIQ